MASAAASSPEQLYQQSLQLTNRGDWNAALTSIDDALARFGSGDSDAVWSLRVLRGYALLGRGRLAEALDAAAPELPPRMRSGDVAVRRLRVLAIASHYSQKRDDAKKYLDAAQQIAEKHPRLLGDVLLTRANFVRTTTPAKAEQYVREALRLAKRFHDEKLQANALATLALLQTGAERFDEAIDASRRALPLARKLGLDSLVAKIEGNAGWAYTLLGDSDTAEELISDANAIALRLGATNDRVTCLLQLGDIRLVRFDYAGAARYYREALDLARSVRSPRIGAALANLARATLRLGDFVNARKYNDEALDAKRAARDREGELRSLVIEARIDTAEGKTAAAEDFLKRVVAESKTRRWEAQGRLGQLYVKANRTNDAIEQFRAALDGANDLRDDIASEELRLSLTTTVIEFTNDYIDLLVRGGRIADALTVTEESRARTLAEGLGGNAAGELGDPRRIARESGMVILSYWMALDHSYLFVVTPESVSVGTLPAAAAIDAAVDAYQKELLGPRSALTGGGRGEQLYRMLVGPAAQMLRPGMRIAIIPDGRISVFNMETLVVPTPRPHYWIEDATIATANAMQFLAQRKESSGASMLLIGNAPQVDREFPALPRAGAEIARVRQHFPKTTLLEGANATPAGYDSSAPEKYAFVHFVAHGIANRQRPLDSAVVLARDDSGYKLYARDVVKRPLNARLVTISSCHGAGNRTYEGEGLVGLAWAFLRAGAHEVIAALWEVSDNAAPELMDSMYAGIRAGRDPATALRDAKLKLLRSNGVYRKPLYWAPFVLYSGS